MLGTTKIGKSKEVVKLIRFDKELLEKANFSRKAIEYILSGKNYGRMNDADAVGSYTGTCMDSIVTYLKIKSDRIEDAKFVYTGCAGSAAAGAAVTELAKGKKLEEAKRMSTEDVLEFYREGDKSIPLQKLDCINIAIMSLRNAIEEYEKKK